jgi:hypothetical protein
MKIRSLFMALPAVALGLACSTMGSGDRTARSGQREPGTATAGTTTTTEPRGGMSSSGASDMKGHPSDQVITGRIADASAGALVIESDQGQRHTLSVVEQTTVTVDGSDSTASALVPGQDVRASFNEQDGRNVAVKVEAMRAPGSDTYTPGSPPGALPPGGSRNDAGTGGTTVPAPSDQPAPAAPAPGSGTRY